MMAKWFICTSLFFNPLWKKTHLTIGKGRKLMQIKIKSQYFVVFWSKVKTFVNMMGVFEHGRWGVTPTIILETSQK
jgi:hypothetical protein